MLDKLMPQTSARTAAILIGTLDIAPVLTGCGGSDSDAEPASTT